MAVAVQTAVVRLMEECFETREVGMWAPFVLHGAWFSRSLGVSGNEK